MAAIYWTHRVRQRKIWENILYFFFFFTHIFMTQNFRQIYYLFIYYYYLKIVFFHWQVPPHASVRVISMIIIITIRFIVTSLNLLKEFLFCHKNSFSPWVRSITAYCSKNELKIFFNVFQMTIDLSLMTPGSRYFSLQKSK